MKKKKRKPCENCPMRIDQKIAEWTQDELDNILKCEGQVIPQMACHHSSRKKEIHCAGWVISQLQNNIDNVGLRLSIVTGVIREKDFDITFPVHASITEAFKNKVLSIPKRIQNDP